MNVDQHDGRRAEGERERESLQSARQFFNLNSSTNGGVSVCVVLLFTATLMHYCNYDDFDNPTNYDLSTVSVLERSSTEPFANVRPITSNK